MHSSILTAGAAVLLALAPSALAIGSASVTNNCGYTVYYASISGTSEPFTALAPGGSMSEGYGNEGQGTSIKIALNDSVSAPVTQFEFTWASGVINYDLSNINGNPFAAGGAEISPSTGSSSSFPTCVNINCPAGQSVCSAAYNQPDDTRTMVCDQSTSLSLVLCPGGGAKRSAHAHPQVHSRQIRHPHGRVWVSV